MNSNSNVSASCTEGADAEPPEASLTTSLAEHTAHLHHHDALVGNNSLRWTKHGYSKEQHSESFPCLLHQAGLTKKFSAFPVRTFLREVTLPSEGHSRKRTILLVLVFLTLMNVGQALFLGFLWFSQ